MSGTLNPSNIRLVSWDVDGTLFSYTRLSIAIAPLMARAAMSSRWSSVARQVHDLWTFHRVVESQRRALEAKVITPQLDSFQEVYAAECQILETALRDVRPRKQALSLLQRFSAEGLPQVALSDFECDYKLEALGLRQHFAGTYSCRRFGFWKPSPVPLSGIQREFGVTPQHHLHIGDRPDTDGAACAGNGCHFMLIGNAPKAWRTFNRICALQSA